MIITFFGHSTLQEDEAIFSRIKEILSSYVATGEPITFYCGGYGDFDRICERACRLLKKEGADCEIVYITPYMTEAQQKKIGALIREGRYDSVLYPPLERVPLRFSILRRNEWMATEADLILAYVRYGRGGAYRALTYARSKKKAIINLAEEEQ